MTGHALDHHFTRPLTHRAIPRKEIGEAVAVHLTRLTAEERWVRRLYPRSATGPAESPRRP